MGTYQWGPFGGGSGCPTTQGGGFDSVSSTKPSTNTANGVERTTSVNNQYTRCYLVVVGFRYVQAGGTPSGNLRLSVGNGYGDCSYGVFDIPNPVSGTYYSFQCQIPNATAPNLVIGLYTPVYSPYNNCSNPGSLSVVTHQPRTMQEDSFVQMVFVVRRQPDVILIGKVYSHGKFI